MSSNEASSSGLINTAAGRPFLVTVIRSCVYSTRSIISENLAFTWANDIVSDMTRIIVTIADGYDVGMRHVVGTLQVEPLDATFGAVVRDVVLRRRERCDHR